jgi:hypothetical protein
MIRDFCCKHSFWVGSAPRSGCLLIHLAENQRTTHWSLAWTDTDQRLGPAPSQQPSHLWHQDLRWLSGIVESWTCWHPPGSSGCSVFLRASTERKGSKWAAIWGQALMFEYYMMKQWALTSVIFVAFFCSSSCPNSPHCHPTLACWVLPHGLLQWLYSEGVSHSSVTKTENPCCYKSWMNGRRKWGLQSGGSRPTFELPELGRVSIRLALNPSWSKLIFWGQSNEESLKA